MASTVRELAAFMNKWVGERGVIVLSEEARKLNLNLVDLDTDALNEERKGQLVNALSENCLCTALGHGRFLMARSELLGIIKLSEGSCFIKEPRHSPKSPPMIGKPGV